VQVFALMTAFVGLVTFALLLALVQQVVLDANTANVRRGAPVYEEGHVSGWEWLKQRMAYICCQLIPCQGLSLLPRHACQPEP
jgi:hypothetical protein